MVIQWKPVLLEENEYKVQRQNNVKNMDGLNKGCFFAVLNHQS